MTAFGAKQSHTARVATRAKVTIQSAPTVPRGGLGPFAILLTSVWFGVLVGLLEVGLLIVLKPLRDPAPGFFRMNRHAVWMVPLDNLLLFTGCGLLLALVARSRPRLAFRIAAYLVSFLAFFTLLASYRPLFIWASVPFACGLGYRLGRRILRNEAGFLWLVRRTLPVFGSAALALAAGSFHWNVLAARTVPPGPPPATAKAPNVLMIVLDTVRADRLSLYGYARETTPNLKRLARAGVRFDRARSAAPWTLPSHSSLMTGRWPHQLSAGLNRPLDATYPTLAEFLAAHGYDTAGFVGNLTYTAAETGLDRGFAHYEDHELSPAAILRGSALGSRVIWEAIAIVGDWVGRPVRNTARKDAAKVSGQFLNWLGKRPRDRPFFAFLNFLDAHNPYVPPYGFNRHFGVRPETPADDYTLEEWFILKKRTLNARQIQLVNDAYDDCLAALDEQIGRLFDELERRGVLRNTLVILTADHGEHFGEHGLYGHASSLYDPEVHVPLWIAGLRGVPQGGSVGRSVTLRDVPATIADLLGYGSESPFPGRSLACHWSPASAADDATSDPLLTEVLEPVKAAPNQGRSPAFRGTMRALVLDKNVYIRNGDGIEELYDTMSDPGQRHDLSATKEARFLLDRFRGDLQRLMDREPPL